MRIPIGKISTDPKDLRIAELEKKVADLSATVLQLVAQHREEVQALKDEIARLKGHKTKPTIRPSARRSWTKTANPW